MKHELKMTCEEFLNGDFIESFMENENAVYSIAFTIDFLLNSEHYKACSCDYKALANNSYYAVIGFLLTQDIKYISKHFDTTVIRASSMIVSARNKTSKDKKYDSGYSIVKEILDMNTFQENKILQANLENLLNRKILEDKELLTEIGKEVANLGLEFAFIKAMIFYVCVFNKFHGINSLFNLPNSSELEYLEELFRSYYTDSEVKTKIKKLYTEIKKLLREMV